MINTATLKKIRAGYSNSFVYLLELFDQRYLSLARVCNSKSNITFNSFIYNSFSFEVKRSDDSHGSSNSISIVLPNFSEHFIDRRTIDQVQYMNLTMVDSDFPNDAVFEYLNVSLTSMTIQLTTFTLNFQQFFLDNKKFPYRRFNKLTHPTLYEED